MEVKFDKDWDPNSGTRGVSGRITNEDIEKIRTGLSELFADEFSKRLSKAGYPVVTTSGDDVLRIKAAIIDLYVNAPEKQTAGISRSYTMDAGRATVVMQAEDSVTGQSLARVVDTQQGLDNGRLQWTTSVSNSAEARRIVGLWAQAVVRGLDKVNGKAAVSAGQDLRCVCWQSLVAKRRCRGAGAAGDAACRCGRGKAQAGMGRPGAQVQREPGQRLGPP